MKTKRQRERVAAVVFCVAWIGGWAIGYPFTHDLGFLIMPTAVLAGSGVVMTVAYLISEWIERGRP